MTKVIDLYSGDAFDALKLKADGYSGVIFKGGQGTLCDVPRLHSTWRDLAHKAGLDVGWYWVVDSRYSPESQKAAIKGAFPTACFDELGMWLDVEKPYVNMTDAQYWQTTYAGWRTVESVAYGVQAHSGKLPKGIYTSPGMYALIFSGCPQGVRDWFAANMLLWTAQWPWIYIPGVSKPTLYGSWKSWTFWQYREGPDVDLFNGEQADYIALFGGDIEPPEPEPEPVEIKNVSINVSCNNDVILGRVFVDSVDVTNVAHMHVTPIAIPAPPEPPEPPAPPAPATNLYDIKIRTIEWFDQPAPVPPNPGSFAIIGGRGQQNWLRLGKAEIAFIRSIKYPAMFVDNNALWNWAATDAGTVYIHRDDAAGIVDWPIGLMSSCAGQLRQYCAIDKFDPSAPYQKVLGIPYQANGDYSAFTPDKTPWFWFFCPTIYPVSKGFPNGRLGWTSHNNLIFLMPFFQAGTGFKLSADAAKFGGMIATSCFLGPHK